MKSAALSIVIFWCMFCMQVQKAYAQTTDSVDLVVSAKRICTMDDANPFCEVMVINKGVVVETGKKALLQKYKARKTLSYPEAYIYPGFMDAHSHLVGAAKWSLYLDLTGVIDAETMAGSVKKGGADQQGWIQGRGWDQTLWPGQQMPDRKELDRLFPYQPVYLKRIDGHAALANGEALLSAGFTTGTRIPGGSIMIEEGEMTGILLDAAADSMEKLIPPLNRTTLSKAILRIADQCQAAGLTSVADCGLDLWEIQLLDSLMSVKDGLKLGVYVMANPTLENRPYAWSWRPTANVTLAHKAGMKVYADGALGSRGALLRKPYSDDTTTCGLLLHTPAYFDSLFAVAASINVQVSTHCIGDSALAVVLAAYAKVPDIEKRRWRIEHSQIATPQDQALMAKLNIIYSTQPTHAVSDGDWAKARIGDRINQAYTYQTYNQTGRQCFGTDFPVERIEPLRTFYAACFGSETNEPKPLNSGQLFPISKRMDVLRHMTVDVAYAQYEDGWRGTLAAGSLADFVVLDTDLLAKRLPKRWQDIKVLRTVIRGRF